MNKQMLEEEAFFAAVEKHRAMGDSLARKDRDTVVDAAVNASPTYMEDAFIRKDEDVGVAATIIEKNGSTSSTKIHRYEFPKLERNRLMVIA